MTKTIGWLLPRLGWTLVLLYIADLMAQAAVAVTLGIGIGFHSRLPDWFVAWTIYGMILPIGFAAVAAVIWGAVELVRYWKRP